MTTLKYWYGGVPNPFLHYINNPFNMPPYVRDEESLPHNGRNIPNPYRRAEKHLTQGFQQCLP